MADYAGHAAGDRTQVQQPNPIFHLDENQQSSAAGPEAVVCGFMAYSTNQRTGFATAGVGEECAGIGTAILRPWVEYANLNPGKAGVNRVAALSPPHSSG